jgi:3',5'-cyclic-AMP phosphodiesterase
MSKDNFISRRSFLLGALATTMWPISLPVKAESSFQPFSFAFVSDIHLTHGVPDTFVLTNESQLFFQDVVSKLNQQKLDFVLFGGDQVHGPGKDDENWQLFLDIAQGLNAPWSFVLGEYDVTGGDGPVNKMRTFGPDWRGCGIETDNPYWSMSPLPGVHVVGLDTSHPDTTTGHIDAKQLAWLRDDLQKNSDKFTIVTSHHPILTPSPFATSQVQLMDYLLPNAEEVREVITSVGNVGMSLSAHLYVNQLARAGKTWFVSNPGLVTYPCAYKIFHVTPETINMQTVQVSYPALIKKAQDLLPSYPLSNRVPLPKRTNFVSFAKGNDAAWNSTLPVDPTEQISKSKKRGSI